MANLPFFGALFVVFFLFLGSIQGLDDFPPYQTRYYDQSLDHFNFEADVEKIATFKQRYLFSDYFWGKQDESVMKADFSSRNCKGPIFFYTGNESPVTDYYKASGFFTQILAKKYGALLIFAEHRYFGESMPFGKDSFKKGNIGFCSTDQALADYAVLIRYLKQTLPGAQDCPVIAFGGSYGGMLTTWFRMKYPDVTIGGLAASAPFNFYNSGISPYAFTLAASETFESAKEGCGVYVSKALSEIQELAKTESGRNKISNSFKLCNRVTSYDEAIQVLDWVVEGLQDMAMLDYPYATDYGISLPGWPVNKTCDRITTFQGDIVDAMAYAIGVFYNHTGSWKCYDIKKDVPDFETCCGWQYLYCTVTYLPSGSAGIFPHYTYNLTADIESCKAQFGVTLQPEWPLIHWGSFDAIKSSSNIIFSNGLLDPWHTSGVLKNLSDSLIAVVIPAAAHHLDLRAPNEADPIYVVEARKEEERIIASWIQDYFKKLDK